MRLTALARIEPLGPQLGVWPKQSVPETLADLLFGDLPDAGHHGGDNGRDLAADPALTRGPCATWAVLDAARLPNLPEELEASGLQYRCLFRGKAEADWGHVAPWLVAVGRDARLTRRLFTADAPFGLWDCAAAMFLRSRRTMDELWRHFRKYTRIQDDGGNWLYFRFWEAQSLRMLQRSVAALPEARRFFTPCELVLAPVPQSGSCLLIQPIDPPRETVLATTLPPTTLPPTSLSSLDMPPQMPVHPVSLTPPLAQGPSRASQMGAGLAPDGRGDGGDSGLAGEGAGLQPGAARPAPSPLLLREPLDDVREAVS